MAVRVNRANPAVLDGAAVEVCGGGRRRVRPARRVRTQHLRVWSGVCSVRGRWVDQPKRASTVAEETAHGIHAPAGDVLGKRPDGQA